MKALFSTINKKWLVIITVSVTVLLLLGSIDFAFAQRRGGGGFRGGGGMSSGVRSSSINQGVSMGRSNISARQSSSVTSNRTNVVRRDNTYISGGNTYINTGRPGSERIDRDIDIDVNPGWRTGAVITGAAITGAAFGSAIDDDVDVDYSVVYDLPSNDCIMVEVDFVTYVQCGSNYYLPAYDGTTVVYQPVPAP